MGAFGFQLVFSLRNCLLSSLSTHLLADPDAEKERPLRDVDASRSGLPPPRYTRPFGNQDAAGVRSGPSGSSEAGTALPRTREASEGALFRGAGRRRCGRS
eukprot:scaffold103100_cov57-Phaeocystis_antarctica.AAC.1